MFWEYTKKVLRCADAPRPLRGRALPCISKLFYSCCCIVLFCFKNTYSKILQGTNKPDRETVAAEEDAARGDEVREEDEASTVVAVGGRDPIVAAVANAVDELAAAETGGGKEHRA